MPNLGPQQAGMGGGVMDWIKANPGKAGMLGLGGAGLGAYGLYNALSGDKEDKQAEARDLGKRGFLKKAADVKRHNAVQILNYYLVKQAKDATPFEKKAFAIVRAELVRGANINTAMKKAFPKMAAERRGIVASNLVKKAMNDFVKVAMNNCGPMSYTGKPSEGQDWMKRNS